jgi:uncharacterized protein (DUF58 family)
MNHDLVRVLAQYLLYFLIVLLPALAVLFTDRFRRQPDPAQYAVLFAVGAIVGVLLFLPAVSIIAGTALAALGIARLTGRWALAGVTVHTTLGPDRLFPGDVAELTIEVDNRKPLPLAWLSLTAPIRHGLVRPGKDVFDHVTASGGFDLLDNLGYALIIRTAIGPFQRLTRTYQLTAHRRGVYSLGPARVEAGDPFGIFRRDAELAKRTEIIVYPRIYDPAAIGIPFRETMGQASAPRALLEDPILLAGSREYRPGDPLHRMHWKATARTGELQVRTADPSTTAQILVVLNLNTFQHVWQGVDLDRMEATIEVAASVALWLLDRDFPVGVRSNGIVPGLENTPRLAPSANPRQPALLLEHLARLAFSGRFTAEAVLEEEAHRLPIGATILFVTPIITPSLIAALSSPRLSGRVSVVYCGRFAAPVVRGVPIHLVVPPREIDRAAS